jgi:phosphotriesterase-related protein
MNSIRSASILLLLTSCLLQISVRGGGLEVTKNTPPIPDLAGKVLTVNGPIDPAALGATMMHEHIFINQNHPSSSGPTEATRVGFYLRPLAMDMLGAVIMGYQNRDNLILGDEEMAVRELEGYRKQGGGTLVDATSIGLGRDPQALRRVSKTTGVHIIMGASWYTKSWHPRDMDDRSVESLTQEIVQDITIGVGGSGIRSGIIGEVGTIGNPLTQNEIKVIRASGRAARLTGAAVSLHTAAYAGTNDQHGILDLLESQGADLGRVILGHSDSLVKDMPLLKSLLERGAYVEFDLLGEFAMLRKRVTAAHVGEGILQLIKMGYLERILLSQDVDRKIFLKSYGGMGYSFVLEQFVPHLLKKGVTQAQIRTLVEENPQRVLTFDAPG